MSESRPASEPEFDVVLGARLRGGDQAAFEELYRRHAPAVLRAAWGFATTREAAEDLVQETFVTLWRRRRDSIIYEDSALPWLLATCRNHWRNERRRRARKPTLPLDAAAEWTDSAGELRWVHDELGRLSPVDRRLCELILIEGHSYREAAAALDISAAAVGKRLERAKFRLRKEIVDHGD